MDFSVRTATESDLPLVFQFIRDLADYEGLLDQVTATEEILRQSLFVERQAEVAIGSVEGKDVCFALYFHNFSTFTGSRGLYLEDFYVRPEWRSKGIGRKMFSYLARLATERGCLRFEWWCLDSHKKTIEFYTKMGARPMSDWTVYRLDGEGLKDLSRQASSL